MKIGKQITLILTVLFAFSSASVANAQKLQGLNDEQPKVTKAVAPQKYPHPATAINAQGEVRLQVEINNSGKVVSVKLLSGHPLLRQVSIEAAGKWVFESSENIKRAAVIVFDFKLEYTKEIIPEGSYEYHKVPQEIYFSLPYQVTIVRFEPQTCDHC